MNDTRPRVSSPTGQPAAPSPAPREVAAPAEPREASVAETWRRRLGYLAFAALIGALVWGLWPIRFGGATSYTIVAGHSMEPTYHTGDLAMGRSADHVDPGDVIVYRVPAGEPGEGKAVIHRVVGGDGVNGYTTKGDNSASPDIWHPTSKDVVGRVVLLIPQGGVVLRWVFSPIALAAIASAFLMWALWPRQPEAEGEESDAEHPTALNEPDPAGRA